MDPFIILYPAYSLTDFLKKYFISEKARALPSKLRILLFMKGNSVKMTMDRIDQKEQNNAKKAPSPPPAIKKTLYFFNRVSLQN